MSDAIHVTGKEEILKEIEALGRLDEAKAGLAAAALYLKGKLQMYPEAKRLTRASVYGTPFKTTKQRKAFFAMLRDGTIEVPYRRGMSPKSERFKAAWTQTARDNGLTQVLGNDTSYGPELMDRERQSFFMRQIGWRTTDAIMDEERETVIGYVSDSLDKAAHH